MTLINTGGTALTGSSVTIGSIPSTYNMLYLMIEGFGTVQDGTVIFATFNGDTNSRYSYFSMGTAEADQAFSNTKIQLFPNQDDGTDDGFSYTILPNYTSTTSWKMAQTWSMGNWYTTPTSVRVANFSGFYNQTTAITSIELFQNGGYNFDAGTAYLYGVK